MSINWVMPSATGSFTPLPDEQQLAQTPPRISLSLQSLNKYPGREPYHLSCSSGTVYLTNRRIIYLPDSRTPQFQSFAAPLLNLHDSHVTAPWFGPNGWVALVQPVLNGGIPSHLAAVELRLTFKDGGAYDFHNKLVQIKERMAHAVQIARERDASAGRTTGGGAGNEAINWEAVHLDELPAYEEASSTSHRVASGGPTATITQSAAQPRSTIVSSDPGHGHAPAEPPPGYEETQRDTVAEHLERSLALH